MTTTTTKKSTCALCEAMCGIVVSLDGGRAVGVKGDDDDPLSRGHICPKATALLDLEDDPDRLVRPLRQYGSDFREVSWEEAFDFAAHQLNTISRRHGANAIGLYQGNPTVHSLGAMTHGQAFTRALKTKNRFSATSADQLPHMFAALHMFGHQFLVPIPDVDRTQHLLILGANPLASNGSLMSAPGIKRRLRGIQRRGGRVVVIDPRRTETADLADAHHFIRPGQDALLLAAMVQVLFADNLVAMGRLEPFVDDVDPIRQKVQPFAPENVADAVGIAPDVIRQLAHDVAQAESAAVYPRFGVCTNAFGGLGLYLATVLNVLTGNLDREGGVMFTLPAVDVVGLKGATAGHFARRHSRVEGLPEFGGEFPVSTMTAEMTTPGDGQIRALVTQAGNPVLSTPSGHVLDDALANLEFMLSIDFYVNETTRHADVILPPTPPLQRDHYDMIFHVLAVQNTAKFAPAVVDKPTDAKHDWEIFGELTSRLDSKPKLVPAPVARLLAKQMTPKRIMAMGLKRGPHDVTMKQLLQNESGVDLGPLTSLLPGRLQTRSGQIEMCPDVFLDDMDRLQASLDDDVPELVLIGRRQLRSNNSWLHNSKRLMKGKNRCTLRMHPDDAAARDVDDGDVVKVRSDAGQVDVHVDVSDEMMPGVVSLPHGFGHTKKGIRLEVAAAKPGVSINDLTSTSRTDALTGNAAFSGEPVKVAKVK